LAHVPAKQTSVPQSAFFEQLFVQMFVPLSEPSTHWGAH
jgi:hypothetical protein